MSGKKKELIGKELKAEDIKKVSGGLDPKKPVSICFDCNDFQYVYLDDEGVWRCSVCHGANIYTGKASNSKKS